MSSRERTRREQPRRLRRALLWFLVLLVAAIGFAPLIVAHTPLLAAILAKAVPPRAGTLMAQGAGGGWMSPLSLSGVVLRDPLGETVLEAAEVKISQNLIELLSGAGPLKLLVERPVVRLVVRPNGTNLQDILLAFKQQPGPDQQPGDAGGLAGRELSAVAVRGATIYVTDAATGGHWLHQGFDIDVDLSGGVSTLKAQGRLGAAFNQFEPLAVGDPTPNFRMALQPSQGAQRLVNLEVNGAPVSAVGPLARRADPRARLEGAATGRGTFTWNVPPPPVAPGGAPPWIDALLASGLMTEGSLVLDGFTAQGRVTGGDVLRLARVEVPWRVRAAEGRLVIDDLRIDSSEIGAVRLKASLTPRDLSSMATGGPATWGEAQSAGARRWPQGRLGTDIDIARLAQLAPAVVALRSDVRPISGRIILQLDTEQQGGDKLVGQVTASNFTAEAAGKLVSWDQPFSLNGTLVRRPNGLLVESLRCESEFINGDLRGDLTNLQGNLGFDLDKLAEQLGQFVDLRNWRLAGRGSATLSVEEAGPNRRRATFIANLTDVMVAHQARVLLQEPELKASLSGEADLDPATGRPTVVQSARAGVNSGADDLVATLVEPLALAAGAAPRASVTLKGDLTSWQNRLRVALAPIVGLGVLGKYQAAGQVNLTTEARLGREVVQFWNLQAAFDNLRLDGGALAVREKRVDLSGDFNWDRVNGLIESQAGELVTSTLTMRSEGVKASIAPGRAAASGRVALRTDLARLNQWFVASDRPQPTGSVKGMLDLSQQQDRLHATVNAAGTQVAFLDAATKRPLLQEPNLQLAAEVTYIAANGQVTIDSATVTSNTLRLLASGGLLYGVTQFSGTADYDLTAWAPVIAGYLGPEVRVTGKHQGRFSLSRAAAIPNAPPLHWSRTWRGRVEAPWTAIDLFGLPIGPGQLGLTLADGEVQADPLQVAVSSGSLTTQFATRLDPPPALWRVSPGPLVTNVEVTPQISTRMLKYIAPVLADATRSQGVFSLKLDAAGGPIEPLRQMSVRGQLDARNVLVTPGPTTAQLVGLAKQVEALVKNNDPTALLGRPASETTLLSIGQRTINFKVENGRVHHDGLEFQVGGVTIQSAGSVGLDETLDIVLTVPIQDAWVAGRPLMGSLQGKSIQIPVRGTLGRPSPDSRALENLLKQAAPGAVGGLLQKLLGN